jgi:hypothetical protein
LAFSLSIIITACKSDNKDKSKIDEVDTTDLETLDTSLLNSFFDDEGVLSEDIKEAKKIFHSIPSPLETAMLLKSAGAEYDQELLNSRNNTDNYTSSKSKALNLGIYTTDLSFASLFNQTQTSILYMKTAQKMAEGLDISDAISNETLELLEEKLDERDEVMDIISETFLNSSAYLKENQREDVAAIVLVGGWIEGLYLATKLVGDKPLNDNELVDRILEQKLSFNIVRRVLADNLEDESGKKNEDILSLIKELQPLKVAFDKVEVKTTESKPVDEDANVTTIVSQTTVSVTPADFEIIKKVIDEIRTSFIQ